MLRCFRKLFCCQTRKKEKGIYVLKLKEDKIYVGESNDIEKRIWVHKNSAGSAWTKKYDFIERIEPLTRYQSHFSELAETILQMEKYGIDNVRGSMFTNPYNLSENEKIIAAQLYCELNNLCRKCGRKGHFINQCKSGKLEPWVDKFGGKLSFDGVKKRFCIKCKCDISDKPIYYRYCMDCYHHK
tara:strand:- start:583 stop:1137 length:555 start_codon:yes stop_codon:yes gene_type:complete